MTHFLTTAQWTNLKNWGYQHFELSRGGQANNLRSMEGMRGFAVFLVFLVHYAVMLFPWFFLNGAFSSFLKFPIELGHSGVDLFFVLSGYLIYSTLIKASKPFLPYMMRRVQRIYPTFLAVFVLYFGLSFLFPAQSKIPANPLDAGVYLVQNLLLLPGLFPINPMIMVSWSLSYEMFYYLAIPLVIGLFGLRKRSVPWRIIFFSVASILLLAYCAVFGSFSRPDLLGGQERMSLFLAGILLYELVNNTRVSAPKGSVALVVFIVGLLSCLVLPIEANIRYPLRAGILFLSFLVVCWSCFQYSDSVLTRFFCWTPLRWLGNMSYSYYLIHSLAINVVFLVFKHIYTAQTLHPLAFFVGLPFVFVATLVPAIVLFLAIERPFSLVSKLSGGKSS